MRVSHFISIDSEMSRRYRSGPKVLKVQEDRAVAEELQCHQDSSCRLRFGPRRSAVATSGPMLSLAGCGGGSDDLVPRDS